MGISRVIDRRRRRFSAFVRTGQNNKRIEGINPQLFIYLFIHLNHVTRPIRREGKRTTKNNMLHQLLVTSSQSSSTVFAQLTAQRPYTLQLM